MIKFELKKKTPLVQAVLAPTKEVLAEKVRKKDNIIYKEFKRCPYKVGDVVTYNTEDKSDKQYGHKVQVHGIAKSYIEYGKDVVWCDPPLIVNAFNLDTQIAFMCTVDTLKAL